MFNKTCSVMFVNEDKQKYIDRAIELGYKPYHTNIYNKPCNGFIKLYYDTKVFNIFEHNQVDMEYILSQEEFFGLGISPKDVFNIVSSLGYKYIYQNGDHVFACRGNITKNKNGRYTIDDSETFLSKKIDIKINWPDSNNKIYPILDFITVKLNDNYTAKVYKDKIEVGCETFSIDILDRLIVVRDRVKELVNKANKV